jgi:hypothetical protein
MSGGSGDKPWLLHALSEGMEQAVRWGAEGGCGTLQRIADPLGLKVLWPGFGARRDGSGQGRPSAHVLVGARSVPSEMRRSVLAIEVRADSVAVGAEEPVLGGGMEECG